MLETIEKLLILQDRDRKIRRVKGELAHIEPERHSLKAKSAGAQKELAELEANREELAGAVDDSARGKYERLVKNKGENVLVGIQHGVCGGCHMKLQPQLLVSAQAQQELITCSNCGRILYYTRDMD